MNGRSLRRNKMDRRTSLSKIKLMLQKVKRKKISLAELNKLIILNVGGDKRTINACLRIMQDVGFIKDVGNCKFKILHRKIKQC